MNSSVTLFPLTSSRHSISSSGNSVLRYPETVASSSSAEITKRKTPKNAWGDKNVSTHLFKTTDILFIQIILDKITQYAFNPLLSRVCKTFEKTVRNSTSRVIYDVFIVPRNLPLPGIAAPARIIPRATAVDERNFPQNNEEKNPIRNYKSIDEDSEITTINLLSKPADSLSSIWKNLSIYHQMMEQEYKKKFPLMQYSDYVLQPTPYGIFLEPLPFTIHWDEGIFENKQKEKERYSRIKLPPDFKIADTLVLRQMSYFLAKFPNSATSSNAINVDAELLNLAETAKLIMVKDTFEARNALQHEVNQRTNKDPTFLSRLFRYIFDQIYTSSDGREEFYVVALAFASYCAEHLTYADFHYALLAHLYTVFTRTDRQSRKQVLKIPFIDLMFTQMKNKKAAVDQAVKKKNSKGIPSPAKPLDFSDLIEQLQIFLSTDQHEALIKKTKPEGLNLYDMRRFPMDHEPPGRLDAVIKIIEGHLPLAISDTPASSCIIA